MTSSERVMADHGKNLTTPLTRSNSSSKSPDQVEVEAVADIEPRLVRLYDIDIDDTTRDTQTLAPVYLQPRLQRHTPFHSKYAPVVVRKAAANKQSRPDRNGRQRGKDCGDKQASHFSKFPGPQRSQDTLKTNDHSVLYNDQGPNLQRTHRCASYQGVMEKVVIGFKGFIDILYETKKLPWGFTKSTIYKLGLFVYFFLNFIYSVFIASVQGGQYAYCLVYMSISLIGFIFEFSVIITALTKGLTQSCDVKDDNHGKIQSYGDHDQHVNDYCRKGRSVLVDYVISSIGEFLIYPTLICVMYGFINERSWEFDNEISGYNLILLVYSVIMDALYMKFYLIWLVKRVLFISCAKYDELRVPSIFESLRVSEIKEREFIAFVLAIAIALVHWLMTAIIGVRIYVDNFVIEKDITNSSVNFTMEDDINSSILETGDYRVAPFTGFMIACTIYLPIINWIVHIVHNGNSFYQVYSAIHQLNTGYGADNADNIMPWKDTAHTTQLFLLYDLAVVLLMAPFIAFTVGAYLPDYTYIYLIYSSEYYEEASSAVNVLQILNLYFILSFIFCNIEIFTVVRGICIPFCICTTFCGVALLILFCIVCVVYIIVMNLLH